MSKVESIEHQIQQLSPEELATLRDWFVEYDAENWDRQFEADVAAGRLDKLGDRALQEHLAGRSSQI
jgi:hypothetical protein